MTIMDFLKLLIVGTVVCGILDLLTARATKKSISSLTHFTVRAPKIRFSRNYWNGFGDRNFSFRKT